MSVNLPSVATRLGWDEPPLGTRIEEPQSVQPSSAIPQGADFLANPPRRFRYRKWGIEYRLIQNTEFFVSYSATSNTHIDFVLFLKDRRQATKNVVKGMLKGANSKHHFEDANLPVASLLAETVITRGQRNHTPNGLWSLCKLHELTGINPGTRM